MICAGIIKDSFSLERDRSPDTLEMWCSDDCKYFFTQTTIIKEKVRLEKDRKKVRKKDN